MSQTDPRDSDPASRLDEAEQPDGRLIIYEESPAAATVSGRWIVGDSATVER